MTDFPTDAEREAAMTSRGMHFGLITTAEEILATLAPLIRAREAAAWDAGYDAGHQSARAVNPEWPDMPTNPFEGADQ